MLGFMQFGGSGQNSSPDNGDAEPPRRPGLQFIPMGTATRPGPDNVGDIYYTGFNGGQLLLPTAASLGGTLDGYHVTFHASVPTFQAVVSCDDIATVLQLGDLELDLDGSGGRSVAANSAGATITFVYFNARWIATSIIGSWLVVETPEVLGGGGGLFG